MAIIEKSVLLTSKDKNGDTTIIRPYTTISNVKGGVAMINGVAPSANGNIMLPVVEDDTIVEFMQELFDTTIVTDKEIIDFINGLFEPMEEGNK